MHFHLCYDKQNLFPLWNKKILTKNINKIVQKVKLIFFLNDKFPHQIKTNNNI